MLGAAFAAWAAAAAGCAAQADEPAPLVVRGVLASRVPIVPGADAIAVVELRDADAADGAAPVAEGRLALGGRSLPLAFELTIDPRQLVVGRRLEARGGIVAGGRPAWVSESLPVDVQGAAASDVGTLWLERVQWLAFATRWRCGASELRLGIGEGDRLRMIVGGEAFEMRQVPAASGERFEAVGDPSTHLWNEGDVARATVRGRPLADCVRLRAAAPGAPVLPLDRG
jgi:uncharacterized lipoprotein YbaY